MRDKPKNLNGCCPSAAKPMTSFSSVIVLKPTKQWLPQFVNKISPVASFYSSKQFQFSNPWKHFTRYVIFFKLWVFTCEIIPMFLFYGRERRLYRSHVLISYMQLSRPEVISKEQVTHVRLGLWLFIFSPVSPLPYICNEHIMMTHFVSIYDVDKLISKLKCFWQI